MINKIFDCLSYNYLIFEKYNKIKYFICNNYGEFYDNNKLILNIIIKELISDCLNINRGHYFKY